MNQKNIISVVFFVAVSLLFHSCNPMITLIAKKQYTKEQNAIPPDFGKDESTLICILINKKYYDKKMKKIVAKHYHGAYEFIEKKDLLDEKYKDTLQYRYMIDFISYSSWGADGGHYTISYYIYDRSTSITYKNILSASEFKPLLKAYMINLEKERIKFHPPVNE